MGTPEDKREEVVCREVVELATDYLEGAVLAPLLALMEAHLAECDDCSEYLEQIRKTIRALRRWGETPSPEPIDKGALIGIFREWAEAR